MSYRARSSLGGVVSVACLIFSGLFIATVALPIEAAQFDIFAPPSSGAFGTSVTVLPNGNIVVTDPSYFISDSVKVGAIYLYSPAGNLISSLTGSSGNDQVGSDGVVVVGNSNFVVSERVNEMRQPGIGI